MLSSTATKIQDQYNAGQRDFPNLQLRHEDLHGLSLKNANLQGADFSSANLRNIDFSGANLTGAYFNEADLTGANLESAILIDASFVKSYLIKTNLQNVNLQNAYLSGAYLTRGNLENALLQGAYFNGTQLTGAKLKNAQYDKKTKFDHTINTQKLGLVLIEKVEKESLLLPQITEQAEISDPVSNSVEEQIAIDVLLEMFNHLLKIGQRYLGETMTTRYWKSSKPDAEWVKEFAINDAHHIIYIGSQSTPLSQEQLGDVKGWMAKFVKSCSMIIQNYTEMLDPELLAFPLGENGGKKTAKVTPMRSNSSQRMQRSQLVAV